MSAGNVIIQEKKEVDDDFYHFKRSVEEFISYLSFKSAISVSQCLEILKLCSYVAAVCFHKCDLVARNCLKS